MAMLGAECSCFCEDCTGFCYIASGGSTCWGDTGNAHIAKITNTEELLEIDGLGVIGFHSVSKASIQQAVTYDGQSIVLGDLKNRVFTFPVASQNSISLSSVGSRNTGIANLWRHPVGPTLGSTACGPTNSPAATGGQGGYILSVPKYQGSSAAFVCTVAVGCNTVLGGSWNGPLLAARPSGVGTYYYVLVDNQNVGTRLNGTEAATCGSGPMIEHGSRTSVNFSTEPIWNVPTDCLAFLLEAWILPA